MDELAKIINSRDIDEVTRAEVRRFAQIKFDEQLKLKGRIAKDLRRIGGEDGFLNPRNYVELERKYRRGHAGKKKLAILEMLRQEWCR